MQNKAYPRDWLIPGRVRVLLKHPDGTPVNPEIPNSAWALGCTRRLVRTTMS